MQISIEKWRFFDMLESRESFWPQFCSSADTLSVYWSERKGSFYC